MRCWRCDYRTDSAACEQCGVWVIELNAAAVPEDLRPLLLLARRWGIPDDGYRTEDVDRATASEITTLAEANRTAPESLWDWLAGHAADAPATNEYVALTCLTMAFDQIRFRAS